MGLTALIIGLVYTVLSQESALLCCVGNRNQLSLVHFSVGMRLLVVLAIAVAADALHFYLDANQKRCFIEELPTDTVVEGMLIPSDQLFRNLIVRT